MIAEPLRPISRKLRKRGSRASARAVKHRRKPLVFLMVLAAIAAAVVPIVSANASSGPSAGKPAGDNLGIGKEKIKHVWLIILDGVST
jgi:hypothetical protein